MPLVRINIAPRIVNVMVSATSLLSTSISDRLWVNCIVVGDTHVVKVSRLEAKVKVRRHIHLVAVESQTLQLLDNSHCT